MINLAVDVWQKMRSASAGDGAFRSEIVNVVFPKFPGVAA
jgi:hypothetical protein